MSAKPRPISSPASVVLEDGGLHIRDLTVDGAMATLARESVDAGRDLELIVREALELGAAVLLHGSAKGTVDAVSAEVDRLLTALDENSARIEAVRRVQQRVAAKGFSFEDALGPVLDGFFASHEDIVEATGTTPGVADEKVGDFVVTVNPRDTGGRHRRIVFEAKDRALTMSKALAELDAAMLNRDAQVGVLVFARPSQAPAPGRPMRAFPGNRLMVVWDVETDPSNLALEVCAQLARTLAIAAEREDLTLDRSVLADRLAKLTNATSAAAYAPPVADSKPPSPLRAHISVAEGFMV
jgi:hypothetical protein